MTGSGVAVDVGSDSILVSGIITVNEAGADNTGSNDNSGSTDNSSSSNIYFENGTCKCPNATVGDTAVINGTTYTAVNNSTIVGQISAGNYNLCTTLITDMSELFKNNSSFNSIREIPISCRFAILVARRVYRQIGYEILKKKDLKDYEKAGKIFVTNVGKIKQTFLSLFDFIILIFLKPVNNSYNLRHEDIKKEINLNERF